ncbi:EFR1 family ferrodoxin [Peptostreptococcus canis]|uniref:4Fe-4S binding protein n=1 Tax=Peptostreptococcus canis TaxID=1159213 RepID=A0ABR6TIN8_9FIRM|nr:EFR1 family ferrodoxin [Peptostreptococcus canis]MBC2575108.1 4Fe-4S binding protein [Peptostreptococcus canis]MBP1997718.1 ferredoxin/flavodoxin [Peptostreptococcus canis]
MKRICVMYFSGTDNTKKVSIGFAESLKKHLGNSLCCEISIYNFTPPENRKQMPEFDSNDILVLAVPTIAGRVPNLLLPYLSKIKAKNSLGVPIVTFGNRNFDDSLIELSRLMEEGGCNIIAGGAFIGEHSFSEILAKNRPDQEDFIVLDNFAKKVAQKILSGDYSRVEIDGEIPFRPYFTPRDRNGNSINFVKIKPVTDTEKCDSCGICAKICPLGSIDKFNFDKIIGKCMKCCACIKKCHTGAKYFDDEGYIYHMKELEDMYFKRKEPKVFI